MSLDGVSSVVALRARAHPLRLQMLSLLTGAAMSAAELGRELGISQALASYHLRQLASARVVTLDEEQLRRGGRERRYRYHAEPPRLDRVPDVDDEDSALVVEAVIDELRRRSAQRVPGVPGLTVDAELWVDPHDWETVREKITAAAMMLHARARRPHEPGTVHVNTTMVLFTMLEKTDDALPTSAT